MTNPSTSHRHRQNKESKYLNKQTHIWNKVCRPDEWKWLWLLLLFCLRCKRSFRHKNDGRKSQHRMMAKTIRRKCLTNYHKRTCNEMMLTVKRLLNAIIVLFTTFVTSSKPTPPFMTINFIRSGIKQQNIC